LFIELILSGAVVCGKWEATSMENLADISEPRVPPNEQ